MPHPSAGCSAAPKSSPQLRLGNCSIIHLLATWGSLAQVKKERRYSGGIGGKVLGGTGRQRYSDAPGGETRVSGGRHSQAVVLATPRVQVVSCGMMMTLSPRGRWKRTKWIPCTRLRERR